jgi:hypothetical protein
MFILMYKKILEYINSNIKSKENYEQTEIIKIISKIFNN